MNKNLVQKESELQLSSYYNLDTLLEAINKWKIDIPLNACLCFRSDGCDNDEHHVTAYWFEEETDEEFEKRQKALKAMAEESEFARWQLYNQLKKEFEK